MANILDNAGIGQYDLAFIPADCPQDQPFSEIG